MRYSLIICYEMNPFDSSVLYNTKPMSEFRDGLAIHSIKSFKCAGKIQP